MGYDSRLYIVKKYGRFNDVEVIARFECGKMGSENWWRELFDKPFNYTMYAEDNDTEIVEDDCGDKLKYSGFRSAIEWLEEEIKTDDYCRLKLLLSLLKGFDFSEWTEEKMMIVHYGH